MYLKILYAMVKTILINIMGTSPMVSTEMFQYLHNSDEKISDVIMVHTANSDVVSGTMAACTALVEKFNVRIHTFELEFNDISTEDEMIKFIEAIATIIKQERKEYNVEKIILNVSGGRKIQTIILSLYSPIFGIDEVYNIINRNIMNINENYEKVRDKIMNFGKDESLNREIYGKYRNEFDEIFYPSMENLYFLKVPVIRFPNEVLYRLKTILNSNFREDNDITESELLAYKNSGFITYDNTRIYLTGLGSIIKSYLEY